METYTDICMVVLLTLLVVMMGLVAVTWIMELWKHRKD
jgi:hypothetical protein